MFGSPLEHLVVPVPNIMIAGCHLVVKENTALNCIKQPLYHKAFDVSRKSTGCGPTLKLICRNSSLWWQ